MKRALVRRTGSSVRVSTQSEHGPSWRSLGLESARSARQPGSQIRAAVLVALFCTGCFAVNDPSAHQPEALLPGDFCQRYIEVVCGALLDCTAGCAGRPPTRETCEVQLQLNCTNSLGPLTADPRTGYDPDEMAIQMAIGARLIEYCSPEFWTWANERGGILDGFAGTVEEGGSCDPLFVETADRIDTARFSSCRGDALCAEVGDGDWRCVEPVGEGEPCVENGCAEGLACGLDGRCGPGRAADGEVCLEPAGCASSSCQRAVNGGVCLSTEQSFCDLVWNEPCQLQNAAFVGEGAGPLVVGGRCDQVLVCARDDEQVAAIRRLAPSLECDDAPGAGDLCLEIGYAESCRWTGEPVAVLDPAELEAMCRITRVPGRPEGEPVPPLLVCAVE